MKNILNLISVSLLLYVFTFYVDGEMGVIVISFMLSAFLLSLAFALYGRKRVKVSLDCDAYVKSGSEIKIKICVEKIGKFPLPIIEIKPGASLAFEQQNKVYRMTLVSKNKSEFIFKLPSNIAGNGEIYIDSVFSSDFLGFIKFKIIQPLPSPKSVGIIPEIPEVTASSELFRFLADAVLTSDEDEENDTAMLFSANTAPGYEHRDYVAGDSLKRVNWKLSSKTSKLMVRLDEASSAAEPCIVLNLFRKNEKEVQADLQSEEKLIKSVFGLISLLVKQGIACTFVYHDYNGNIYTENVDNPDAPSQILLKVLAVKVKPDVMINMSHVNDRSCAYVIATTDVTEEFKNILSVLPDMENTSIIVPDSANAHGLQLPVWYMTADNKFKLV